MARWVFALGHNLLQQSSSRLRIQEAHLPPLNPSYQIQDNSFKMHNSIFLVLSVASTLFQAASSQSAGPNDKTGWSGKLSSLDGGLGGTVTVVNTSALVVNDYALEDASAPALYWWGSKSSSLGEGGFRISNEQVKEAAKTNTYVIPLDAGKTTADFSTVGLWCEKFSVNFGQASLAPSEGGSGSSTTPTGANPSPTSMKNSAAGRAAGLLGLSVPALLVVYFST